jgi:membrane-bound acyltransferase YfiQ involved in biofilm formation
LAIIFLSLIIYGWFFFEYLGVYFETGVFKISRFQNRLLVGSILLLLGIQFLVFAFLADMIKSSRKVSEDEMYERRKQNFGLNKKG